MVKNTRFKGVQGVRSYVARVLIALERLESADVSEATKLATAKFAGCRLMAELITSTALEKRIKQLEKGDALDMRSEAMENLKLPGPLASATRQ